MALPSGTPAPSDRLGAAIEQAAGEVEDTYGVSVDTVVVGDAVLDEALSGMVQAAREAMVNSAKSSGTQAMSVYVEVEGDKASAFVRDRGRGFDLDAAAPTAGASASRSSVACSVSVALRRSTRLRARAPRRCSPCR